MTTKVVTVPSQRTSRTPVTAPSAIVMVVDPGIQHNNIKKRRFIVLQLLTISVNFHNVHPILLVYV